MTAPPEGMQAPFWYRYVGLNNGDVVELVADERTYYDGCRDTLYRYAIYRNGRMEVGAGLQTYQEVLAQIDKAEAEGRSFAVGEGQ